MNDERRSRRELAHELLDRMEELCVELRGLTARPPEKEQPDDPLLEYTADQIEVRCSFVKCCTSVHCSPSEGSPEPWLATIKAGGTPIAEVVRAWDSEAEGYCFVSVPIDLQVIVDAFEEELRTWDGDGSPPMASHEIKIMWELEPEELARDGA